MSKVLIIEDDLMIGDMLTMYLTEEGYTVTRAIDGQSGLQQLETFDPDIILLDLVLPDIVGMEMCTHIRGRSNVPILVISMKTEVADRVNALQAGADDYLCKPFSMRELTARIGAMLRRSKLSMPVDTLEALQQTASAASTGPVVNERRIILNLERRMLTVDDEHIEATYSEFEIMRLFCSHPGKVYTREEFINALRGFDSFVTERAIDVHIANLRKKIELNPKEPKYIRTVWGVGYKYVE